MFFEKAALTSVAKITIYNINNIIKYISVVEYFLKKIALLFCNFIRKGLRCGCFHVNYAKGFRIDTL